MSTHVHEMMEPEEGKEKAPKEEEKNKIKGRQEGEEATLRVQI